MSEINSRSERRNFLRTGVIALDPPTVLERLLKLEGGGSNDSPNIDNISRFKVTIPEGGGTVAFITQETPFESVDWGDGNIDENPNEENETEISHDYTVAGDYIINIKGDDIMFTSVEYPLSIISLSASLTYLDLSNCTGLTTPPVLTGLTSLTYLDFYNCTGLITPPVLTGLNSLDYLNFNNCTGLTTPPVLTGLTSLTYLDFYNCTGLITPPVLTGLNSLDYLNFNNCTGLTTPPVLTGLTSLTYLDLGECIGLITPPVLTGLTSLTYLDLSNCTGLTTPPVLTGLTSLTYLDFNNCTGLSVDNLDTILGYFLILCPELRFLNIINGKDPTPETLQAAREANPQCEFQTNSPQ